jgi:hypothetical protein
VPHQNTIKIKANKKRRTFIFKATYCTAMLALQKQHIKRDVFMHCVDYACKNETFVAGEDV